MEWTEHQEWEREWHSNCVNSINEELKQLVYARKMGLKMTPNDKTPYSFDLEGKKVLDIGGGAYSLLLKCENFSKAVIVDPCDYPKWIYERYNSGGISSLVVSGEDLLKEELGIFDEVWIYNLLQHVKNPKKVIKNALASGKIIRMFEWIENGITKGHPNNLTKAELDLWLKGIGKIENLNESGCVGLSYYGIFKGNHYGE